MQLCKDSSCNTEDSASLPKTLEYLGPLILSKVFLDKASKTAFQLLILLILVEKEKDWQPQTGAAMGTQYRLGQDGEFASG